MHVSLLSRCSSDEYKAREMVIAMTCSKGRWTAVDLGWLTDWLYGAYWSAIHMPEWVQHQELSGAASFRIYSLHHWCMLAAVCTICKILGIYHPGYTINGSKLLTFITMNATIWRLLSKMDTVLTWKYIASHSWKPDLGTLYPTALRMYLHYNDCSSSRSRLNKIIFSRAMRNSQ